MDYEPGLKGNPFLYEIFFCFKYGWENKSAGSSCYYKEFG
jgi:hypothetical protein